MSQERIEQKIYCITKATLFCVALYNKMYFGTLFGCCETLSYFAPVDNAPYS